MAGSTRIALRTGTNAAAAAASYEMSDQGDSGALWLERSTRLTIGIQGAGDLAKGLAYAVPVPAALDTLSLSRPP
jgi:hypothetical protein